MFPTVRFIQLNVRKGTKVLCNGILDLKTKTSSPETYMKNKEQYKAYNPTLKKCNLFLNENLAIIDNPDKNLLNKKSEVIFLCRNRRKFKLVNLTSRKNSNDVI